MSSTQLSRRQMLIGVGTGAIGAGALAALAPAAALANEDGGGLIGAWDLSITQTSPTASPTIEGVAVFSPGGSLVTTDAGSPTAGLGTWTMKEHGGFALKFLTWDFSNPSAVAKVVVKATGTLAHDTISGPFTFDVFVGGTKVASGAGSVTGTRLKP